MNENERVMTHQTIQQSIEMITPELASHYLKGHNRPITHAKINIYATDMLKGNWHVTHQGIAFADDGKLLDGQHRLLAIIKTGLPVRMNVTRGLKKETFRFMDIGKNRTATDILSIEGFRPRTSKIISASVPYCYNYENGLKPTKNIPKNSGSHNEWVMNWVTDNPMIVESAEFVEKMPKRDALIKQSLSCFFHYQINKNNDDANEFMTLLLTGDGVTSKSPVFTMRAMLIATRIKNIRLIEEIIIKRIILTYNHFHRKTNNKDWDQAIKRADSVENIRLIQDK